MEDKVFVFDEKRIWCIDTNTGNKVWQQGVGGFFKGGDIKCVSIKEDKVLVALEYSIYCFDIFTGKEVWNTSLEGVATNKSIIG